MTENYYKFPESFIWGCSTASYQVEGAVDEDGRGPSIWDAFSHSPGNIKRDHTGDVASDQYHRYKEDVQFMKWLGLKAYRFSISWSRIFPEGSGQPNKKGIAYYERLVDELLANGIEPWVTLFHFDLPQTLEDRFGGWESRETAKYFGEYAAHVTKCLSDRVMNYFTINEFKSFTDFAYKSGQMAPGKKLSDKRCNQIRHNAVLAHGLAVEAIRANARKTPNVGIAEAPLLHIPVIESEKHINAAYKATREVNAPFLTAVLEGKYLDSYLESAGDDAPEFTEEDMTIIGSKLDFVGVNVYAPIYVQASEQPCGYEVVDFPESYPQLEMQFLRIAPEALYWAPRLLKEVWNVQSVVISENGGACKDKLTCDKKVYDLGRIMWLRHNLISLNRALKEGWPVDGYFVWTLLDNFEWDDGFEKRFGLLYVNYETLERIPKLSAEFYKEVIAHNTVV